jgi:N-acetylmuramoyl-L-alanine amidase
MYKFGANGLKTEDANAANHVENVAAGTVAPALVVSRNNGFMQRALATICTNCLLQRGLLAVFLCAVAGLTYAAPAASTATISATRIWPAPIYTRVTFEAPTAISHQMLLLQNPSRLVVDIEATEITPELAALAQRVRENDPYIKQIRVARNKPGTVRVVLDLKADVKPSLFTLGPAGEYKHRLILDVYPLNPVDPMAEMFAAKNSDMPVKPLNTGISSTAIAIENVVVTSSAAPLKQIGMPPALLKPEAKPVVEAKAEPAKIPAVAIVTLKPPVVAAVVPTAVVPTAVVPTAVVPSSVATAAQTAKNEKTAHAAALKTAQSTAKAQLAANLVGSSLRQIIIVIDAGHGGEDPGASGRKGTKEKDVTLSIAKKLKEKIDAQPNMQAVLTRDDDYFIALHERVNIARSVQADLFVSIHADAFVRPDANGASVFALSEGGATSAAARWLATRENEADLIGGVNLSGEDPYLAKTLLDLSQTASINDSLKLGKAVLAEIGGINRLHKAQVQQAGFAVLKAPDIPSILVETAFISNPDEEKRLKDKTYQGKLADAITEGIVRYFEKNPPLARTAAVASNDRLN